MSVEVNVPALLDIHLVTDNYGTHKTPSIKKSLARHPRFQVHFTPTCSLTRPAASMCIQRPVKAQEQAGRLQRLIDLGEDPRRERAVQEASDHAARDAEKATRQRLKVTGLLAWEVFCAERNSHWSVRKHADHAAFAAEGGRQHKRAAGKTIAGPLRPLLSRPLTESADYIKSPN